MGLAIPAQSLLCVALAGACIGGGGAPDRGRTDADERAASRKRTSAEQWTLCEQKVKQAFGDDIKGELRLYVPKQGLVLVTDSFTFEADGRLKLTPCAVAWFEKGKEGAEARLLTSVRSGHAYLTVDRPITNPMDLGNCRFVILELEGGMRLEFKGR